LANQTYPKCPKGDWHEAVPFWFWTDSLTAKPRGIMCLFCDDAITTFDDEAEARVVDKRRHLGRAGLMDVGYTRP
jgi:hypothetical protein